jgi:H+/Cl- antiporter ClcA
MNAVEWLPVLTLGALLGAVGQVIRTIAGLKKLKDDPVAKFDPMQLMMSVIIGAAAGVIAMVTLGVSDSPDARMSAQDIITVIASGYTGADFIEAFITRSMSSGGGLPTQKPAPVSLVGGMPDTPNSLIPTPASLINKVSAAGPIPPVAAIPPANNAVG